MSSPNVTVEYHKGNDYIYARVGDKLVLSLCVGKATVGMAENPPNPYFLTDDVDLSNRQAYFEAFQSAFTLYAKMKKKNRRA